MMKKFYCLSSFMLIMLLFANNILLAQNTVLTTVGGPYTWYPPAGVSSFFVQVWGGGAGGSTNWGGSGGSFTESRVFTVTASDFINGYTYDIGAGGGAGTNGGDSHFWGVAIGAYGGRADHATQLQVGINVNNVISWLGGYGGSTWTGSIFCPDSHQGGGGGSAFTNANGADGHNGDACGTDGDGGAGTGKGGQTNGAGFAPGGGGSGGYASGARGEIRIFWTCNVNPGLIGNGHTVPYPNGLPDTNRVITSTADAAGLNLTYTWMKSTDTSNHQGWSVMPGIVNPYYFFPVLTQNTFYRRDINGCNSIQSSNVVLIKVFYDGYINPLGAAKNGQVDGYVKSKNNHGVFGIKMQLQKNIGLNGSPQSYYDTATTGTDGHYIFNNVFYGDYKYDPLNSANPANDPAHVNFTVTPVKANHIFDPVSINTAPDKYIAADNNKRTLSDIIDNTVFDITGKVVQICTDCMDINDNTTTITSGADNVQISSTGFESLVFSDFDGSIKTTVSNTGKYTLVPSYIGSDPVKKHQFVPATLDINVNDNVSDILFEDVTKHTISGKLTAGAGDYIGQAVLEFSDSIVKSNGIKIPTFRKRVTTEINTGNYSITLPARKNYSLRIVSFTPNVPEGDDHYISEGEFLDFFNNLAAKDRAYKNLTTFTIDSFDVARDIVYHRKPNIELLGLDNENCNDIPLDFVVFKQNERKYFRVNIWEGPKSLNYKVLTSDPSPYADTTQKATLVYGSTAVTLNAPNSKITVGKYVTGPGIAPNTAVSAVAGTSLTLSLPVNETFDNTLLSFGTVSSQTSTFAKDSSFVTLSAANSSIAVGAVVTGAGIAPGTIVTVYDPSGTLVKLSTKITAAGSGVVLKFGNPVIVKQSDLTAGDFIKINSDVEDITGTAPATDHLYQVSFGSIDTFLLAGAPNIISVGTHPYGKQFTLYYTDRFGRAAVYISKNCVVTGLQSPPQTFTTVAPEIPTVILHRPPGDLSYSFWEKQTSVETANSWSIGGGLGGTNFRNIYTGVDITNGIGVAIRTEAKVTASVQFDVATSIDNNNESITTTTFNQKYQTGTAGENYNFTYPDGSVKNEGDVYVGGATNYKYGISTRVYFNNACQLGDSVELILAPAGFATTFSYSEFFIAHTLLPALQFIGQHAADDTTREKYLDQVNVWKQVIANNDKAKKSAAFVTNRSFNGGTGQSVEDTYTESSSKSSSIDFHLQLQSEVTAGLKAEINGTGTAGHTSVLIRAETGYGHKKTTANTTTTGYHLEDANVGDYYSVDIKTDPVYGTPVFALVAGTSSCPVEPGAQSRDQPKIFTDSSSYNGIPVTGIGNFQLHLSNLSDSREDRYYNLFLDNSTSNGLIIKANGTTLGGAGAIINYRIPYRALQDVDMTVEKTNKTDGILSYPGVKFHLVDDCNSHTSLNDIWNDAVGTIDFNFASTCGGISLAAPKNNWAVAKASNNILPVTFNNYQQANIETVTIQYATVGTNNWFSVSPSLTNSQVTDPTSFTYNWDVTNIPAFSFIDSALIHYKIRLKLKCIGGNIVYSTEAAGVIDRDPPFLAGKPEPSDNNFVTGDEISFAYNEEIKNENIKEKVQMVRLSNNTGIPVSVNVSGNKILVVPEIDIADYVGDSVRVLANNLFDLYGNEKTRPDTFYFYIGAAPVAGAGIPVKVYMVNPSMPENSTGKMEVHFKLPQGYAHTGVIKVYYKSSGTAMFNADYTVTSDPIIRTVGLNQIITENFFNGYQGYINIDKNKTEAILKISPVIDALVEGDEFIKIDLSSGGDYILQDSTTVTAVISDPVTIIADGPTTVCTGGTVGLSAPASGNALVFDGVNDYVSVNNKLGNFGAGDFTIEMDVKTSSSNAVLASKRGICGYDNYFSLGITGGSVNFELAENTDGYNYTSITSSSSINDNAWHHVAVISYQGSIRIYIDGNLEAFDYNYANIDNTSMFTLGTSVCVPGNTDPFIGQMDEVRIWNVSRTDAERQAGMNSAVPSNSPGLLAYYKCNEATGISLIDASSHGNNGIAVNGLVWIASTAPINYASYLWSPGGATTSSVQATTGNYTVQATDANGSSSASAPVQVTIGVAATVSAGSSLLNICPGITSIALGGSFRGGAGAVWSDSTAGGAFSSNTGSTPNTTTYTPAADANGILNLKLTSIGGCTASAYKQLFINGQSTWLGTSSDWGLGSNWSNAVVPISCTKVIVPSGLPFMPIITGVNNACFLLQVQPGATVNVATGATLIITGKN